MTTRELQQPAKSPGTAQAAIDSHRATSSSAVGSETLPSDKDVPHCNPTAAKPSLPSIKIDSVGHTARIPAGVIELLVPAEHDATDHSDVEQAEQDDDHSNPVGNAAGLPANAIVGGQLASPCPAAAYRMLIFIDHTSF